MAQRGDRLVLSALYLVVGVMQIVVALWLYRLLPGMAMVLMVVGGLLCVLAGLGKR
jgi:predicted membrane channel-forming protein YqfA (hemolysin III family)